MTTRAIKIFIVTARIWTSGDNGGPERRATTGGRGTLLGRQAPRNRLRNRLERGDFQRGVGGGGEMNIASELELSLVIAYRRRPERDASIQRSSFSFLERFRRKAGDRDERS